MDAKTGQLYNYLRDPVTFASIVWPTYTLYDKQVEIMRSVVENDETIVPAGNQLGKDFITGMIVVWWFCSRLPAKIVTIAPGQTQLETVLWGEIRRFLRDAAVPLPIKYNHLDCKYILSNGELDAQSRMLGIATNKAENVQGQHLARGPNGEPTTLAVFDEASGVDSIFYDGCDAWSHRRLIIGNPLPCTNFFFTGVELGDIKRDNGQGGYFQKVIKIRAKDSPNVRLAEAEIAKGKKPSNRILIPGVVNYSDYCKRRKLWDPIKQSVGLDAEFYKGAEVLLYPPEWINLAEKHFLSLGSKKRNGKAIGVDSAEGGDDTVWTIVDEKGVIEQIAISTENTTDIPNRTIALIKKYRVKPENVLFDLGGGGKQHADQLRDRGYNVRVVAFGGTPTPVDASGGAIVNIDRDEITETRQEYKNKRAQMYGDLRKMLDPENGHNFALSSELNDLRHQMTPMPLMYDAEGRLFLPPKDKPNPNYKGDTIRKMLGRSPDHLDSLVLAVHGLLYPARKAVVGALDLENM